jgi:hypothetical protein
VRDDGRQRAERLVHVEARGLGGPRQRLAVIAWREPAYLALARREEPLAG